MESSANNGTQEKITVKADSVFTFKLACSAGQGFSWQLLDSNFTHVQYVKQDFKNLTPDKDGGDGEQTFYFKAVKAGEEKIELVYVQPFVKPRPANVKKKTYAIQIINQ